MDAASTLQMLMPGRPPDQAHLRSLVREMAQARDHSHAPTRFYGEMVDLLAERGDFKGAVDLESAWNRVLAHVPATVLCGYSSSHFGNPRHRPPCARSATTTTTSAATRPICSGRGWLKRDRSS